MQALLATKPKEESTSSSELAFSTQSLTAEEAALANRFLRRIEDDIRQME